MILHAATLLARLDAYQATCLGCRRGRECIILRFHMTNHVLTGGQPIRLFQALYPWCRAAGMMIWRPKSGHTTLAQ